MFVIGISIKTLYISLYCLCLKLAIYLRQSQYFMPGIFNSAGLMTIHMTGFCSDHTFIAV